MTNMRIPRAVLLLTLFVLTQACATAGIGRPTPVEPRRPSAEAAPRPRVKELSGCSGDRFRIDLLDAIEKMPDDTLDAQREQLRDWVFTATLARIAQRVGADEVLTGVADEPLVRDDALAHVLHTQSGPARSTSTKSGGAIVLVQADDLQTMAAQVAEALDEEALHIGSTPGEAQVYQYVFKPEVARAEVCAMKPLSRAEIEGAAQGYRSATITAAAELEAFLEGGVDLLSAQCTEAGLEVKGRQRPRAAGAPVTVEHIAALSQARGTNYVPIERFGASLDKLSKSNRATIDHNAKIVDTLTAPLEIQSPAIQIVTAWKRKNPKIPTQALWLSYDLQAESVGRPGFSLDPKTSAPFATEILDDVIAALPDVRKVGAILRGLKEEEDAKWLVGLPSSTNEPFAAEARKALIAVRDNLKKATNEEAEAILNPTLSRSLGNDVAVQLLQAVDKYSSQQCARYDGPLLGTETGMTFFYTDLLAKTWKFDLNGSAPEGPIEGFQSGIHGASSTTSCEETSGKSTRTWLGVREESFTREPSGAVRFEPIATRIFAKSANIGARKEEFEATAESRRFVQWWDDHFPEIAAWEPQYELLNQLMKWSVVIHNATIGDKLSCFAPLDQVAVRADRRIDKWVTQTSGLRWRGPVELLRGKDGAENKPGDPECLNLFQSERFATCGGMQRFSGGVTAASVQMVQAKPMRAAATPPQLGRLGADVAPIDAGSGRVQFKEIARSGGKLENVSVESAPAKTRFAAEIKTNVSQVGVASSWDKGTPIKRIDKSVEILGKEAVAKERKNGLVSAELKMSDLTAADVKVELRPSTVLDAKAKAQKVAKRMLVDGVGFDVAIGDVASTNRVVVLGEGRAAWQVEVEGAKKWIMMESGPGNRGPPSRGAEARFFVGVPDGGSHLPGSPQASRSPTIRVTISNLLDEKKTATVEVSDPTFVAVKEKVGSNDIEGAMKELTSRPSAGARNLLIERALAASDDATLARVVDNATRKGASAAELGGLGDKIRKEIVLRTRDGRDVNALEQQEMRLAIAERRALTPGRSDSKASSAAEPAIYSPVNYPVAAELPPAVHPPGKLILPDDQYISRVVEVSSARDLPNQIEVNGLKYDKRAPGREAALDYGAVGSSWRLLLGGRRPIRVVLACNDRDASLPSCHERPSPEEVERYNEAMKCDLDGDRRLDAAQERDCLDAQRKRKEGEKPASTKNAP
jgi:hypothetical protein